MPVDEYQPEPTLELLLAHIESIQEHVLGRRAYAPLDAAAQAAAEPHLEAIFGAFSRAHEAWLRRQCRDAVWQTVRSAMRSLLHTTLYRDYWQSHRAAFCNEFRAAVDELLS